MNKKTRQIAAVTLGLLIMLAPIFVSPFIVINGYYNQTVFVSVFVCIGLPLIWHGIYGEKFKNRRKQPPRSSPMTEGTKTGLAGVGIVFLALFIGVIGLYAGHNPLITGLFFLLFFIGVILLYVGSYMSRKERENALHQGS